MAALFALGVVLLFYQNVFPTKFRGVGMSNFVVHEIKERSGREQMMRGVARVLKPGAWLLWTSPLRMSV